MKNRDNILRLSTNIDTLNRILAYGGCSGVAECYQCPMSSKYSLDMNTFTCDAAQQHGGGPITNIDATSRTKLLTYRTKLRDKIKKLESNMEQRTMTRKEAWNAMLNGEKVSPPNRPDVYMYYDNEKHNPWRYVSSTGANAMVNRIMDDLEGYILYAPPKKVVQMWQYVYAKENGKPRVSGAYFTNAEEATAALAPCQVLQRADWTEIEVEV